jgi:2'-5' RNA ligase
MRLFTAIEFPEDVAQKTYDFLCSLAKEFDDPGLRWVGRDQMHLTLKFLGEVDDAKVGPLGNSVKTAAAKLGSFGIQLQGIGGFGSRSAYRVIWLGTQQGAENAQKLAESIESVCEPLGFPRENRQFHPHVTLARCKTGSCRVALDTLKPELSQNLVAAFTVRQAALIRSTLTRRGAIYETLEEFPLLS